MGVSGHSARSLGNVRSRPNCPPPYQMGRSPYVGRAATEYPVTTSVRPSAKRGRTSSPTRRIRRTNSPSSCDAAAAPRTRRERR
ncbi:hypothetical protein ACFPRL_34215 [Pseudoclavibacter helvolus]